MDKNTDEILIRLIKLHDQKALECLFERYFYPLCEFAFAIVKRGELTEEIVSDVFFNIWSKRDTLEIKSNVKAYLFSATKNQSLNYLNKNKLNLEELDFSRESNSMPENNKADKDIEYKELEEEVYHILERMPPQRRLIFKLHRLEGLKYKEIADVLSISVNTVQNQMVKAVKYIEKCKPKLKEILYVTSFLFIY